jgi:hypothetical protein
MSRPALAMNIGAPLLSSERLLFLRDFRVSEACPDVMEGIALRADVTSAFVVDVPAGRVHNGTDEGPMLGQDGVSSPDKEQGRSCYRAAVGALRAQRVRWRPRRFIKYVAGRGTRRPDDRVLKGCWYG